ncbi:MAG: CehA/McbA family metallohydrolase [Nanoarchaeota archaeon]
MNKNKQRITLCTFIVIVLSLLSVGFVSAASWEKGDLHFHSGYSSTTGYDGNINTVEDNCPQESLSKDGQTISEIRADAISKGIKWITITDHGYCLSSNEWNNLITECDTYSNSSFLCTADMEFTVHDEDDLLESLCAADHVTSSDLSGGRFSGGVFSGGYKAGHLGAHGINNFIQSIPNNVWCPDNPKSQAGINMVNNIGGFTIIHHPSAPFWDWESKNNINNIKGIEIMNGYWLKPESLNPSALNWWLSLLQKGKKIYAFGGTDSHNSIETTVYNYAYLNDLTKNSLTSALSAGRSIVSNNGLITFTINEAMIGEQTSVEIGSQITLDIDYDLDSGCWLSVYRGRLKRGEDQIYSNWKSGTGSVQVNDVVNQNNYYRVECTNFGNRIYTNPIWVDAYQVLTISNNGDDTLTVTQIKPSKSWLAVSSPNIPFTIQESSSAEINISIDYTKLGNLKYHWGENIKIYSNDPDENIITIPIDVYAENFISPWTSTDQGTLFQDEQYRANMPLEFQATENFKVSLDWPTDDTLDLMITDPNGTNYTKNTQTSGFNYSGTHPIEMTFENPINGTWIIWVNATNVADNVTFTVTAHPYSSDTANESIDYKDTRLNYVSTCSSQKESLKTIIILVEDSVGLAEEIHTQAEVKEGEPNIVVTPGSLAFEVVIFCVVNEYDVDLNLKDGENYGF